MQKVTLRADGDLRGTVTCHISETADGTRLEINWRVRTTKRWMNYLAPLLQPLFIYNHRVVMRSGQRGLRRQVSES